MYKVVFSPEFTEWFDLLDDDEQDTVSVHIRALQQYGHQLGRPYADTLKNSKIPNLKELRVQHAGKPYRALYVFDPLRKAVMLCGGDKTGNKRFYKDIIPIAEEIYKRHLKELDAKDNNP